MRVGIRLDVILSDPPFKKKEHNNKTNVLSW